MNKFRHIRNASSWTSSGEDATADRYELLPTPTQKGASQTQTSEVSSNITDLTDVYNPSNSSQYGAWSDSTAYPPQQPFLKRKAVTAKQMDNVSSQSFLNRNPSSYSYGQIQLDQGGNEPDGTPWRAGWMPNFPYLSIICLVIIIATLIAMVVVLLTSDGKDVNSWGRTTANIAGHHHKWHISVSALIALFNFILGKAMAVMFTEAVAVSWWVNALGGESLRNLHYQWEIYQSIGTIIWRWRLWGSICLASIAFTAFAGLEALLQTASFTTTSLSTYPANMTASLAYALPAGFSGVIAALGHDFFGTVYFTPPFVEVLQNYTAQSPIYFDLDGCAPTSNVSCAATLTGVGFQYTCNASRSALQEPISIINGSVSQPNNTVFQVGFQNTNWSITLDALWQDQAGYSGKTVTNRQCTLIPALVEYPVNVTQRIVTLQSPTSYADWTGDTGGIDKNSLQVDKVLKVLPIPNYDAVVGPYYTEPSTHSTIGGLGLAFSRFFTTSIDISNDVTNFGADIFVSGSFAAPYAQFPLGTVSEGVLNNTYSSPMSELLADIRDIMFRSSMAIAQHNITDYAWSNNETSIDNQTSHLPVQNVTQAGEYRIYHTVYKTNRTILGVGVGLMLLPILAILPLYWGFWRLGRKVTMSPLEIAKALHFSTITDPNTGMAQPYSVLDIPNRRPPYGSNLTADGLVKELGRLHVKYGEVAPNVLGMGLSEHTASAMRNRRYN